MTLVKTDSLPVTYQSLHPREEASRAGTAGKLSFSGAVITSSELPPLGSILRLTIDAGKKPVKLFAEVKWHNPDDDPPSFGAFFLMPTMGRMLDLIDMHMGGALDPPDPE
jgi:hypothetical protein